MTETEHILLLRQGADAWNAWREANPSISLDLLGADLNGADLHGVFLRGADLGKANLNRANLSGRLISRLKCLELSPGEAL